MDENRRRAPLTVRVGHLHWAFPPMIGGVETHLSVLLPELAKQGYQVSLLTGAMAGEPERSHFKGVTVIRAPEMSLDTFSRERAPDRARVRQMLLRHLDAFRPDLLHAHNLNYFSRPHAEVLSELCREQGVPLVLTAHNAWNDLDFFELSRNIPWDHIVAVSRYVQNELLGLGCDPRKITVVHHGVDGERFHPQVDPSPALARFPQLAGRRVIFHPARLGLAKGNEVAVKAFHLVHAQHPDAVLMLAGSERIVDWEKTQQEGARYILQLVKAFGLTDHVLIDVFSIEEMPAMYAASEVVLYPSTAPEPFGLTLLEAPAMGKPIVVSNAGGMPEIIRDGVNGFVVPVRDPKMLAVRICQLLENPRLAERLGQTGLAMMREGFTKEIMTEHYAQIYQNLLAETVVSWNRPAAFPLMPAADTLH